MVKENRQLAVHTVRSKIRSHVTL